MLAWSAAAPAWSSTTGVICFILELMVFIWVTLTQLLTWTTLRSTHHLCPLPENRRFLLVLVLINYLQIISTYSFSLVQQATGGWRLGPYLCHAWQLTQSIWQTVLPWFLLLMMLDRLLYLTIPRSMYTRRVGGGLKIAVSVCILVVSVTVTVVVYVCQALSGVPDENNSSKHCYIQQTQATLAAYMFTVAYLIPLGSALLIFIILMVRIRKLLLFQVRPVSRFHQHMDTQAPWSTSTSSSALDSNDGSSFSLTLGTNSPNAFTPSFDTTSLSLSRHSRTQMHPHDRLSTPSSPTLESPQNIKRNSLTTLYQVNANFHTQNMGPRLAPIETSSDLTLTCPREEAKRMRSTLLSPITYKEVMHKPRPSKKARHNKGSPVEVRAADAGDDSSSNPGNRGQYRCPVSSGAAEPRASLFRHVLEENHERRMRTQVTGLGALNQPVRKFLIARANDDSGRDGSNDGSTGVDGNLNNNNHSVTSNEGQAEGRNTGTHHHIGSLDSTENFDLTQLNRSSRTIDMRDSGDEMADEISYDDYTSLRSLALLLIPSLLFWLPVHLTNLVMTACDDTCSLSLTLYSLITWSGCLSSSFNPLLYILSNQDMRRVIVNTLRCRHPPVTNEGLAEPGFEEGLTAEDYALPYESDGDDGEDTEGDEVNQLPTSQDAGRRQDVTNEETEV